jgi:methionyl-tRNA formyltransferase
VAIGADETAGELRDRMAGIGSELMVQALRQLEQGSLSCAPQPEAGVSYATKIDKGETRIDWRRPAMDLHNQIRGLSPSPGAWCELPRGDSAERVRVLRAKLATGSGTPGSVLSLMPLIVAGGAGALELTELQRAGKKPVAAAEFVRGARLAPGTVLA